MFSEEMNKKNHFYKLFLKCKKRKINMKPLTFYLQGEYHYMTFYLKNRKDIPEQKFQFNEVRNIF